MPHNVMIVEDDPDSLQLFRDVVLDLGADFQVASYETCRDAIRDLALGLRPDLIVFDVAMAHVSGNDLLAYRNAHCANVPAIAVTASPAMLTVPGATAVMQKPFDLEAFAATIRRSLKN